MKAHPVADVFPIMSDRELADLAHDIRTNGLREPILTHEGLIIDGRHRARACELAEVEPRFVEWDGEGNLVDLVVSLNLRRRHMDETQRAKVAAKLATMRQGERTDLLPVGEKLSQAGAAELLNVSPRAVARAAAVERSGVPELGAALDAGEVSLSAAAEVASLPPEQQREALAAAKRPHVTHNTGNNEWFTPPEYVAAVREVMGAIDLDPASCDMANATVGAATFFTSTDDGLIHPWHGRVYLNPPYATDLIGKFTAKLVEHVEDQTVPEAVVLVNNATETTWFQDMAGRADAICFPRGRVKFTRPGDGQKGAPLQGQAVVYFGSEIERFCEVFAPFGVVAKLD